MNTKKLHFTSGIIITLFIGIHLFNHLVSLVGPERHIELMKNLRLIYRNVLVEIILLAAVVLQIFSGIKLYFKKRKSTSTFYEKLQIWTGLYLAFFFMFHVSAVMIGRFFLEVDTDFYFGAAGLNLFPYLLFFVPYYSLSIFSFFGHIAAIHSQKMKKSIFGFSPIQQSNLILTIGIIMVLVILYGLTNGFVGHEIPDEFNLFIQK